MRHFPIYLDTQGKRIVVSGAGDCAVAKLRLLLKTEAQVDVFGSDPDPQVVTWAREGRLSYHDRELVASDLGGALLLYAANDEPDADQKAAALARAAGVRCLIVDNLDDSDFITPAIVDRAPVTVAIGTEGAAPVLARRIKADVEAMLPPSLGLLARIGQAFRPMVTRLPFGRARRDFWARYYFDQGPKALAEGEWAAEHVLNALLDEMSQEGPRQGHVDFIGAGPGDPELLTLRARRLLHDADVVIHDRLVSPEVLELARREATMIEVGKVPFGRSWKQEDINALLVEHGGSAQVVRLKSGDPGVFGRLDEETAALDAAGIAYAVTPGITAASAAAATMKLSLTQRGRNGDLRIITGHDARGFADQDWRALAVPGAVAAIYMGKAAARFLSGRLLMHGAAPDTPISIVENASRPDQRIAAATLVTLAEQLRGVDGPAVLMLGLAPRQAAADLREVL
ncbi:MAG: uroporphyrinogen-III C-methyltransferase [Rhodobacterales bacterium]|nr:MAG: uroporphyrinogen-III C-methyltransferase [Rhodobacterales bacterium]